MKTVVLGPRPQALEALIRRRQEQGLDTFDEVADSELLHVDAVRLTAGIDWPTSS